MLDTVVLLLLAILNLSDMRFTLQKLRYKNVLLENKLEHVSKSGFTQ